MRERLLRIAVAAALLAAPARAEKPVLRVWQECGGRLVLVCPRTDAELGWATTALRGASYRAVTPTEFLAAPRLPKGEVAVIFLYDRTQAAQWPDEVVAKFPKSPASVGPDEVLACYSTPGHWCFAVIAPDDAQLRRAWTELLTTDAQNCLDRPLSMLSYKLHRALGVGENQGLLQAWLTGEEDPSNRFQTRLLKPADLRAEHLEGIEALVVALTYQEFREQVVAEAKEPLLAVLPEPVARAVTGGPDDQLVTSTAVRRDGLRGGAVVAPTARFLRAGLARQAEAEVAGLRQVALTSSTSSGGRFGLLDLRGTHRMVLVGDALSDRDRVLADGLAVSIRAGLANQCSLNFLDDQVLSESIRRSLRERSIDAGLAANLTSSQVDLLGVVRVSNVLRQTEYRAGEPRRITPDPGPFTKSEPRKPDPEDRKGPPWNLKPKYPGNANDPEYQSDLRDWKESHQNWERERDHHNAERQRTRVSWERYQVEEQRAAIDGQLELYDRAGKLLLAVPLRGQARASRTTTQPATVTGFNDLPPAIDLPAGTATAAETLVAQAADTACQAIPSALALVCLTPSDAGAAPPPTPAAPPTGKVVVVEGVGSLPDGPEAARQAARQDACRTAVEQVVGLYVQSQTVVDRAELLEDRIYTKSSGFAAVRQELGEQTVDGALRLRCEVEVQHRPLRDALVAAGITRQWRVLIAVPESLPGETAESTTVDTALSKRVALSGLPVIDQQQSAALRQQRAELLRVEGRPELAEQLRRQSGAEILITGSATVEATGQQMGQETGRASLQVRAIDLNTAEVLAADDQAASALDQTVLLAGRAALAKAADQLSDRVIDALFLRVGPTTDRLQLTLRGFDRGVTALGRLETALRAWEHTRRLTRLQFAGGVATLEAEITRDRKSDLEHWLERAELDAEYGLQVTGDPGATIEARLRWRVDQTALDAAVAAAAAATLAAQVAGREAAAQQADAATARTAAAAAEPAAAALQVGAAEAAAGRAEQAAQTATKAAEDLRLAAEAARQAAGQDAAHATVRSLAAAAEQAQATAAAAGQAAGQARADAAEAAAELRRRPVELTSPVRPVTVNGVLLLPVKPVADWLGAKLDWHAGAKTLVLSIPAEGATRTVTLVPGQAAAYLDGAPLTLPAPVQVLRGAMVMPSTVATSLGLTVTLDREAGLVRLGQGDRVGLLRTR